MLAATSAAFAASASPLAVLVAGGGIGGIGGIAAALALVRQGFAVKALEQAPQLGEIGAGVQLGPNGFAAFDALGIGEMARRCPGHWPHRGRNGHPGAAGSARRQRRHGV